MWRCASALGTQFLLSSSSTATNKLLFEAGVGVYQARWGPYEMPGNPTRGLVRVLELTGVPNPANPQLATPAGLSYRSANWANDYDNPNRWRASMSYVTGAHNFKVGTLGAFMVEDITNFTNDLNLSYTFIGGNTIHEDRENGVDIKRAQDVIVSQNTIYGYVVRDSSGGEAVVVHSGPQRVLIVNNVVARSHQGLVSTGATGYYVVGNLILGIQHAAGAAYDPASIWSTSGVLTYNTAGSVHVNNTIWFSDSGISVPNGGRTEVVLPTDDAVRGGDFRAWFQLQRSPA